MLKRAADWLRQHREARILIVGSCDGGSETCTHSLAEARGAQSKSSWETLALTLIKSLQPKVGTVLVKPARPPRSSVRNSIAVSGYSWLVLLHLEGKTVRCAV